MIDGHLPRVAEARNRRKMLLRSKIRHMLTWQQLEYIDAVCGKVWLDSKYPLHVQSPQIARRRHEPL